MMVINTLTIISTEKLRNGCLFFFFFDEMKNNGLKLIFKKDAFYHHCEG